MMVVEMMRTFSFITSIILAAPYVHTPDLIATDDSAASLLLQPWLQAFPAIAGFDLKIISTMLTATRPSVQSGIVDRCTFVGLLPPRTIMYLICCTDSSFLRLSALPPAGRRSKEAEYFKGDESV